MTTSTTPIPKTIDQHHNRFTTDPDYVKGLKAVDHKKLAAATAGMKEKIASVVNYYVYFRSMKSVKLTKGTLSNEAEKALVVRGNEALGAFKDISSRVKDIGDTLAHSGLDKAVDRHMESLCQHLNYNPKLLTTLQELKDMGITEAEISCVFEDLKKNNYNLLKYAGADGTFAGFVKKMESLNEPFQAEQKLMEQFGLPTVQGAGGGTSGTTVAVVVGIVIIAAVLCVITVFYA